MPALCYPFLSDPALAPLPPVYRPSACILPSVCLCLTESYARKKNNPDRSSQRQETPSTSAQLFQGIPFEWPPIVFTILFTVVTIYEVAAVPVVVVSAKPNFSKDVEIFKPEQKAAKAPASTKYSTRKRQ